MIELTRVGRALLLLVTLLVGLPAVTQAQAPEHFAGSTRIGTQPDLPLYLELRRNGETVEGAIVIPGAKFDLIDAKGQDTIVGRYRGDGGSGALTLQIAGDALTGSFDFGGLPGTIAAQRTSLSAEAFFLPTIPPQTLDITTAQWLEDLDRLVATLTQQHGAPFHRVPQAQFERAVAETRAAIPQLDGRAIALEFHKLGALIGDGHTSVTLPSGTAPLPVEFFWFEDGLRVVATTADQADILGTRLKSVQGVPVGTVTDRLRAFIPQGETLSYYRAAAARLLSNPDVLRAIGLAGGTAFTFDVETPEGREKRLEIAATGKPADLVPLGGNLPLWQQNRTQGFWSTSIGSDAVYVNWRSYEGLATEGAALLGALDARRPQKVIIDLRDNGGGDFTAGRRFIDALATRPWLNRRGTLYVLIGRKTFSAAMTNAIDFKQKTAAILVGEPAGAAPNNWQEVRRFYLPNSGLLVGVSTKRYEFLPGKTELRPDHLLPPGPGDWGRPEDVAVRFILSLPPE